MPQAMLRAVAELTPRDIGDDIYGEDATVNELQRRAAELTGKEAVRCAICRFTIELCPASLQASRH